METIETGQDELIFHQTVMTPAGPGIVQGWLLGRNEEGILVRRKVLVSHLPGSEVAKEHRISHNSIRGVWVLAAYPRDAIS